MFKKLLKWFSTSAGNNPKQKNNEIENATKQIIPVRAPPAPVEKYHFEVVNGTAYGEKEGTLVKLEISEPVITLIQKIRNGDFKLIFVGYCGPTKTWELRHKNSNYKLVLERPMIMYDKMCSVSGWDFLTETEKEALEYYVIQDSITKYCLRREGVQQKWKARGRQRAFKKLSSI